MEDTLPVWKGKKELWKGIEVTRAEVGQVVGGRELLEVEDRSLFLEPARKKKTRRGGTSRRLPKELSPKRAQIQ